MKLSCFCILVFILFQVSLSYRHFRRHRLIRPKPKRPTPPTHTIEPPRITLSTTPPPVNYTGSQKVCPSTVTYLSIKNFLFYGTVIESYKVKNEPECATKCFNNPYCESANFFTESLICELNSNAKISDILSYKFRQLSNFLENFKCPQESTGSCGRSKVEPRMNSATVELGENANFKNDQVTEVKPNSYPWIVTLQYDRQHSCTGVLLNEYYILTSASCFAKSKEASSYQAVVGAHTTSAFDPGQQTIKIEKIELYPEYNPERSRQNDLALVKLSNKAIINDKVQPICLPQDSRFCTNGQECWTGDLRVSQYCITIGWGQIGGYSNVDRLGQLVTPILSNQQCNSPSWYSGKVKTSMICAGNAEAVSCAPDLGGPLLCALDQNWAVLGVASWGEGCAREKKPAVYMKIETFLDWIKDVTSLYSGHILEF